MRKKLVILALVATVLIVATNSGAEGIASAFLVENIRVDADGKGYVTFNNNLINTPPSCVISTYSNALSFDTSTAGGKGIYALVLSAKAMGKRIAAYGTGSCDNYSVIEKWSWGYLTD